MKAITTSRVSTEEQADKGNSLPAQADRMKDYCARKGFDIVRTFSFDESAYKTKRREFDKIIEYLESQTEKVALCFDKVDRFSRQVFDKRISILYDFAMQDKIELHFVSDNLVIHSNISATEKFHFGINLGLAKYYSDAISDNVKRAYETKIKKGEWVGCAPLGYLNINCDTQTLSGTMTTYKKQVQKILLEKQVKENRTFRRIEIDPIKGDLVKKVFADYATGLYSLDKMQDRMNEMGLNGKKGMKVSKNSLVHMLTNPFYLGLMKHNGEISQGNHDKLIGQGLFDLVQKQLKERNKPIKKHWQFTFTGLIKCPCGCSITAEAKTKRQQNGNIHRYIYYHCTGMHNRMMKRPCPEKSIEEKDLRAQLAKYVKLVTINDMIKELLTEAIKNGHKEEKNLHHSGMQEWQNMYNKAEEKLNKLFELYVSEAIDQTEFTRMKEQILGEKQKAKDYLDSHSEAQKSWLNYSEKLIITTNHAYKIFKQGTPEEVKMLMTTIGKNYVLRDNKVTLQFKEPFNYVAQLNTLKGSNKTEWQCPSVVTFNFRNKFDNLSDFQTEVTRLHRLNDYIKLGENGKSKRTYAKVIRHTKETVSIPIPCLNF